MKKKNLGIVSVLAAFLMLSVGVFVPTVSADAYSDAIDEVLSENSAVIEDFQSCIDAYIAEHGSIDPDFTVPGSLEAELDIVMHELQSIPGQPQGGGITDLDIWYDWFWCHAKLWLSDWWCDLIVNWNPGIGLLAVLIAFAVGGAPGDVNIVAIATLIVWFGVSAFFDVNEGNGIVAKFEGLLIPMIIMWRAPQ